MCHTKAQAECPSQVGRRQGQRDISQRVNYANVVLNVPLTLAYDDTVRQVRQRRERGAGLSPAPGTNGPRPGARPENRTQVTPAPSASRSGCAGPGGTP